MSHLLASLYILVTLKGKLCLHARASVYVTVFLLTVCVCVCVRERERERERDHKSNHVDQWMSVS